MEKKTKIHSVWKTPNRYQLKEKLQDSTDKQENKLLEINFHLFFWSRLIAEQENARSRKLNSRTTAQQLANPLRVENKTT